VSRVKMLMCGFIIFHVSHVRGDDDAEKTLQTAETL
jgi:hypothetical protein